MRSLRCKRQRVWGSLGRKKKKTEKEEEEKYQRRRERDR
jgi:hypothetical protein